MYPAVLLDPAKRRFLPAPSPASGHHGPARTRLTRRAGRAALVAAAATALLAANTAAASAHVTARADSTASGSFAQITFRVPNESPTAGTVKVEVQLPQDKPFLFVSVKPVVGWTAKVTEAELPAPIETEGTTITKAVRTITWTADADNRIGPGEYQEFSLSGGPLPAAGELVMPATQTYSDGEVVAWDESTPAGGEEPEHPAPAVTVVADTAAEPVFPSTPPPTPANAPSAEAGSGQTASGPDVLSRALAGAALLVALAALVFAVRGARTGRVGGAGRGAGR